MATASELDSKTTEALRQAIGAAQAGDLNSARVLAEEALIAGGDIVALNAFLGMVRAKSGDAGGAVSHLRRAHHGRPEDLTIACNLISVLIESNDLQGALEVATRKLAFADPTLRVTKYRGFLSQALEHFEDAVEAYAYVIDRAPQDFESWNNLGNARSAIGDIAGSVSALQRAVTLEPLAAPSRLNLASALRRAERWEEAEKILRDAVKDFPQDSRAPHELYVQLKKEARNEEALTALEEAVRRDPDSASLQLKLGIEYGLAWRTTEAEKAYRTAIEIEPLTADAYLGLIIQYEHTNREELFAPLITLAESHGLENGALNFLRAMEHRRSGRFEEGLASLALVPPAIEPERTAHLRAMMLDRLGRTDEAFEAFQEANRAHEANSSEPSRRAAELREEIRAELQALTPEWIARWPRVQPHSETADPVFLVGFPRSGTTLLDTILMGHPNTIVMEEQPPLNRVDKALGGFAGISALDDLGIANARMQYFDEVAKVSAYNASTPSLLIDKSPLFLYKAPLIHRLFPNARFILALRHPCDVLLSCFMSNFRLNPAMSNFLRLEDAAEFYDLAFQHWERVRALLPLNVHTVVYERLVEGVEEEVRPLFDWLRLEWHQGALDHRCTARGRGLISTASYSQITEPIYKRASGRWIRYRNNLEPVLSVLEPWVKRFGYTL